MDLLTQVKQETLKTKTLEDKFLLAKALMPVHEDLEILRGSLLNYLPIHTKSASLISKHVLSGDGKLIRPALFLLCCKMLSYRGAHLLPMAAVCELIQIGRAHV